VAGIPEYDKWDFPADMRATPGTITYYNPSAANALWRNITDGADGGVASSEASGHRGLLVKNAKAAGDGVGDITAVHATADAEFA
jgi:hypothetical protein